MTVLTLAIDLLCLLCALFFRQIAAFMLGDVPRCIVYRMGYLCPSCGGTRAVNYFFHGNFALSFQHNPFFFVMIIYLLTLLLMLNLGYLFRVSFGVRAVRAMLCYKTVIAIVAAYALFGIARNLI